MRHVRLLSVLVCSFVIAVGGVSGARAQEGGEPEVVAPRDGDANPAFAASPSPHPPDEGTFSPFGAAALAGVMSWVGTAGLGLAVAAGEDRVAGPAFISGLLSSIVSPFAVFIAGEGAGGDGSVVTTIIASALGLAVVTLATATLSLADASCHEERDQCQVDFVDKQLPAIAVTAAIPALLSTLAYGFSLLNDPPQKRSAAAERPDGPNVSVAPWISDSSGGLSVAGTF